MIMKETAIRQKIAADINDYVGATNYTAYSTHRISIDKKNLPAVVVTTGVGLFQTGAEEVSLVVRMVIHDNKPAVENELDLHSQDIFDLFPIGSTLGGLVEYIKPESFDYVLDTEGSNAGAKVLIFNVNYEV